MEEKGNRAKKIITVIALGQLTLAVVLGIYGVYAHTLTSRQGDIAIGASLFIFWVLMDVIEPVVVHRFENITQIQKSAYLKFVMFDFAGLAGIAYFLFSMGGAGSNGILGAVVYAVSIKLKRENQDIFYGLKNPEDDDEEEEQSVPDDAGMTDQKESE